MKKLMVLPLIAIVVLGSSSCKKIGDCVCSGTASSQMITPNLSKTECQKLDDAAKPIGSCKLE